MSAVFLGHCRLPISKLGTVMKWATHETKASERRGEERRAAIYEMNEPLLRATILITVIAATAATATQL